MLLFGWDLGLRFWELYPGVVFLCGAVLESGLAKPDVDSC